MLNVIWPFLLLMPFMLYGQMKCGDGKCQMGKCEVGKCGTALTKEEKVPKNDRIKQDRPAQMKCEAGKCGSSMQTEKKTADKIPSEKKPRIRQLFNVRTVAVKEIQSSKKQRNYGYIAAQDSRTVEVTAWFSGYVKELYVDSLYQKVKKGQALALIYSPEVYKAKQDYLNAIRFHLKRPSPEMVQSAKTKLLLLGVSQTEILEVRKNAKISIYTTIYASASGWVFEKNINQGSYISNKKSLYTIIDLSEVWMEAKVFQNQLLDFQDFDTFSVRIRGLKIEYVAKKDFFYPNIDPKEATYTLRLSIDNADEVLKPGMYATLYSSAKPRKKLVIPRTAAIRKGGAWYVFLVTEFQGEYEPLQVELKPLDSQYFEVIKGLVSGDTVVNNALFMMDSDAQMNAIY